MVLNSGRSVNLMLNETYSHATSFAFQRGRSVWLYVACSKIMSSYCMLFNSGAFCFNVQKGGGAWLRVTFR